MPYGSTIHEVLTAVFQVRPAPETIAAGDGQHGRIAAERDELMVLLWQRALDPQKGTWSLPGGRLRDDEDMKTSARRQLAEKVDVREVAHLEQLSVFSDPHRVPGHRRIASTFLGLVPLPADPQLPPDTAGTRSSRAPGRCRSTTERSSSTPGRDWPRSCPTPTSRSPWRPREFSMSTLREIYCAALGYQVDTTNLQRVLSAAACSPRPATPRRPDAAGGRPAALYRFTDTGLRVTDEFAALRPPA